MCGRICCTLGPEAVPYACTTVTPKGVVPEWTSSKGTYTSSNYLPSTNVPPTRVQPVLCCTEDNGFILHPMLWGFVPPWHKGEDPTKHGLTTNNARIEGIRESKLYSGSVNKGRRCVVLCDGKCTKSTLFFRAAVMIKSVSGFYEWKSDNVSKQPYLVYASQDGDKKIKAMSECAVDKCYSEEAGWTGPKPLFMAGIYSLWHGEQGQEIFSYSLITR